MVRHHGKFVSYLRVSTKRQGESGLGSRPSAPRSRLPQRRQLAAGRGVRRGRERQARSQPPCAARALEACKVYGATLVIAKLDRLSRDAHFLLGLQKAGVKFVAADMPEANEMVVGIMALVAQAERRMICERTKAALQAAKARGKRLGNPKGHKIHVLIRRRAHAGRQPARRMRRLLLNGCVLCWLSCDLSATPGSRVGRRGLHATGWLVDGQGR